MSDTLFPYYERELLFVRQLAQDFARRHPGAAGRLLLEQNRSADPQIERVLESFALLAGRLHHKLDDQFPELTDALLHILYPHFQAPIPSMAVVQFELDKARGQLPNGFTIAKGSMLHTQPVDNLPCKFRTAYPVTLWPIQLTEARFQPPPFPPGLEVPSRTAALLRLQFSTYAGLPLSALDLERLRFFLHGDPHLTPLLYEFLLGHTFQVVFRPIEPDTSPAPLKLRPEQCLFQVGFDPNEGLLPYAPRLFLGYRLLTEMFTFPQKFHFIDLGGWQRVARAGFDEQVEVILFLDETSKNLEQRVNASLFALGCTPVVNLFARTAESISLGETQHDYRVVADAVHPLGTEIYSIAEVTSTEATTGTTTKYQPFYSYRHSQATDEQPGFWTLSRHPSRNDNDPGSDVYLHLVDLDGLPLTPEEGTLHVKTTCTNRNLPAQLNREDETVSFELEATAPLKRIHCLVRPTVPLRPPPRRGHAWNLLSHLNPNPLSLGNGEESLQTLHDILRLYDFSDPEAGQMQLATLNRQLITGIVAMSTRRVVGRLPGAGTRGFCRGLEVTLAFDEEKYIGTGMFLFASILERFLGLYASENSFCQLVGKKAEEGTVFKKWPPRAGELPLV